MGQKLVIGPIDKGLRTDRTAFVIDNDNFPTLINAYQWRGRVKRKRGTQFLGRLTRFFNSIIGAYSSTPTINLAAGAANLLTGFSIESRGNIVPGTVIIHDVTASITYIDNGNGNLIGSPSGTGTINYATGAITIFGGGSDTINANFDYTPNLPVMGIEDFVVSNNAFPGTITFDPTYAYQINTAFPYPITDVSFYKNPATDPSYPGYVPKTVWTPVRWNGQDYQQFWTVNYQGALWVTNGIDVPFTGATIGMQFKHIIAVTVIAGGPPATANLQITAHGLVVGDFVFVNEVVTTTGINFQTGYVITVTDANNVIVEFPDATIATNGTGGIAQYLTNTAIPGVDCLRWYDGNPTNGSNTSPAFVLGEGWVNFSPPLSQANFSISDEVLDTYYLVGARMIVPFKDRLLFLGAVIQTKSGSPIYLQDTVVFSQNGTAYYTSSFTGSPIDTRTNFFPILTPQNNSGVFQTATPSAYFEDQTGFGGYIQAGIDQPIITAAFNEDVIIVGFKTLQTRLAYTGNDLIPFNFFSINTEYGSSSTFSIVTMDKGVITRGDKGYVMTSQVDCQRIDLDIPDQVFEINATNNGTERFCTYRDFINEWIYFTYPSDTQTYNFPNQTLQFNYRDNSWAIFNECYTTYGSFRKQTGFTWSTVGNIYPSWIDWNDPWDAGDSQLLQPLVLGGNQQGFILIKGIGTGEGYSLYIESFSANQVTSPNHCLNNDDYIIINGCTGEIGSQVNGEIFSVYNATADTFYIKGPTVVGGTYFGGGVITRMYVPQIQTKQFPLAWDISRKTRIGPQMYLLSTTPNAQISLLIYLSQNASSAYNDGPVVPEPDSMNNALIYSTVLYTCPESTNLGLTPANTNLQMIVNPASGTSAQAQIWHRVNTSLIGDTVQLGFTISDSQMRDLYVSSAQSSITAITQANPCVITCVGTFSAGQIVLIQGVVGMTQLNGNYYQVISYNSTTKALTLDVDSTAFDAYVSGGTVTQVSGINGFSEIELHGIILDVSQSQILA
jgi:hypothetical protein